MLLLLKVLVFVALLVLMVFVALSNDAMVDVNLLRWEFTQVRIFLVMLVSALVGLLAGLAFAAVRELQWRMQITRAIREKNELVREIQHLRTEPLKGLDEMLGQLTRVLYRIAHGILCDLVEDNAVHRLVVERISLSQ